MRVFVLTWVLVVAVSFVGTAALAQDQPDPFDGIEAEANACGKRRNNGEIVLAPADVADGALLEDITVGVGNRVVSARFLSDGKVTGAGKKRYELGPLLIEARCQADPELDRILCRLAQVNRGKLGDQTSAPIDGFLVGIDGVRGIAGKAVDNGKTVKVTAGAKAVFFFATCAVVGRPAPAPLPPPSFEQDDEFDPRLRWIYGPDDIRGGEERSSELRVPL